MVDKLSEIKDNSTVMNNKTAYDLFKEEVIKNPYKIAVVDKNNKLTYSELNEEVNKLASFLRQNGVKHETVVGAAFERSNDLIIAILAILKAGGVYLPLDTELPLQRIKYMLNDSDAELILTSNNLNLDLRKELNDFKVINIDEVDLNKVSYIDIEVLNNTNSLAYIIYTSGTTGNPKGVMLNHGGIINLRDVWAKDIGVSNEDIIGQFSTISFDSSIAEIVSSILCGATLNIIPNEVIANYRKLEEYINNHSITIITLPPTYLSYLNPNNIFSLKKLITAGSEISLKLFNNWKDKVTYFNAYGPTESTVCSTIWKSDGDEYFDKTVPIGKPIRNLKAYIIDENCDLVIDGTPGELCVGGVAIARGYLNLPELTSERFIKTKFSENEIIYRTGDLVKWLPNGDLEYLGRIDQQVKIRGFRIELQEIKNCILTHEAVRDAEIIDVKDDDGSKEIALYLVLNSEITLYNVMDYLSDKLPKYMIPSIIKKIEKIPLTINGKPDRKALKEEGIDLSIGDINVQTNNEIEKTISDMWKKILKRNDIGIDEDFFSVGGHSLRAFLLINNIAEKFNIEIKISQLFELRTIRNISDYIINKSNIDEIPKVEKSEVKEFYIASPAQKRMFTVSELDNNSINYNVPFALKIEGNIDYNKLQDAFVKIINRHESLRTQFITINGELYQDIKTNIRFKLEYSRENIDINEAMKEFVKPFNLNSTPLLRAKLIEMTVEEYLLIIDIHHIIFDGVSMTVLVKELFEAYFNEELSEIRYQYKDYSEWQHEFFKNEVYRSQEEFWLKEFKGNIPVLNITTDYERPLIQSFEGDTVYFQTGKELNDKLREVVINTQSTLYLVLFAAYNVLVSKYSGDEDIVVGSITAGRTQFEFSETIGMFVNTLALRNRPESSKSFKEFLAEVKINTLNAFENQDYQFEELVDKLRIKRDISRNPIFDTLFVVENMELNYLNKNGLKTTSYDFDNKVSKFDFCLLAEEKEDDISLKLEYNTRLFKRNTMEGLKKYFINILNAICENTDRKISDIDMLNEEEKNKLLVNFKNEKVEYPTDIIINLFEERVSKTPQNKALVFNDSTFTYEEVNNRVNKIANYLRESGVKRGCIAAVIFENSIDFIVGILAIIKAGAAYLPLDPSYPKDRISYMLKDSGAVVLLTRHNVLTKFALGDLDNGNEISKFIYMEEEIFSGYSTDNIENINKPDDVAYVIYTSGTTGNPKGVMVEHKALVNLCYWHNDCYNVTENDRSTKYAGVAFDASLWEIFPYLISGSTIHIIDEKIKLDVDKLNKYFEENEITISFLPTQICEQFMEIDNKSLRILLTGGDKLQRYIPRGYKLFNNYGPTENTVVSTYFQIDKKYNNIPIGRPISNTDIYILDKNNKLQPVGVWGELFIAGKSLARGYINNPKMTDEKFIENHFVLGTRMYKTGDVARWLPDGNIEFGGRIDEQVKVRGFRIELGEIQRQLLKHEDIKEAIVISKKDNSGNNSIGAYITSDKVVNIPEINRYLLIGLPQYMIPSYIMQIEEVPLTANGKVDKKTLPQYEVLTEQNRKCIAPRNKTEEILVEVWKDVLGIKDENISIDDNFFTIGGDSIKAIQISSRIQKYGLKLNVADLLRLAEIQLISPYIKKIDIIADQSAVEGEVALTSIQKWFFENEFESMNHFNHSISLFKKEGFDRGILTEVFTEILLHHDALRMIYIKQDGKIKQFNRGTDERLFDFYTFDLDNEANPEDFIESESGIIQRSIDLENGPLVKVALFTSLQRGDYLLIIVHHLIMDGVSWRILIEDFNIGYEMCEAGQKIRFQDKTCSFKEWSKNLNEYAQSKEILDQIDYWSNLEQSHIKIIPKDYETNDFTMKNSKVVEMILPEEYTNKLLKDAVKSYNLDINDILISALGCMMKEWTGEERFAINLEGHGRENINSLVSVERTIGWFTSMFPVVIDISECDEISKVIKVTKETLRNIPNKGMGYGVIKYLSKDEIKDKIDFCLNPEVSFNYLGQFNSDIDGGSVRYSDIANGKEISGEYKNTVSLTLDGIVVNNQLRINFIYNGLQYDEKTIITLSKIYKNNLIEIIEYCMDKEEIEYTASDFSADSLDEYSLDTIFAAIAELKF